jgi:hypothetical protein
MKSIVVIEKKIETPRRRKKHHSSYINMTSSTEFPKPKFITGGCLCEALRYRIDFPENHDFEKNASLP